MSNVYLVCLGAGRELTLKESGHTLPRDRTGLEKYSREIQTHSRRTGDTKQYV